MRKWTFSVVYRDGSRLETRARGFRTALEEAWLLNRRGDAVAVERKRADGSDPWIYKASIIDKAGYHRIIVNGGRP